MHRPGSAWQRRPGLRSALTTALTTLRHPIKRWCEVRPRGRASVALLLYSALATGAGWTAIALIMQREELHEHWPDSLVQLAAFAVAGMIIVALAVALSLIEALGLRFFARRMGLRLAWERAIVVVGHASVGWAIGPALPLLLAIVYTLTPRSSPFRHDLANVALIVAPASALLSLLAFETLAFLGQRALRYANHPPATQPNPAHSASYASLSAPDDRPG